MNVTGEIGNDDFGIDESVYRFATTLGGSISAEHGIGTAKRRWLATSRSSEELAVFADIKRAFDPKGVLNPNVLLPRGWAGDLGGASSGQ